MELTERINTLFGEAFSWDLFIEGAFFWFCALSGLLLLAYCHGAKFKEGESLSDYLKSNYPNLYYIFSIARGVRIIKTVSIITIIFVIMIITGILSLNLGDEFMDLGNNWHLGFKKIWVKNGLESQQGYTDLVGPDIFKPANMKNISWEDTDSRVKIKMFHKVFPSIRGLSNDEIRQIYYHSKHKVLSDEYWRKYLNSTQTAINLTQVFSLSFMILFFMSLIAYLSLFMKSLVLEKFLKYRKNFLYYYYPFGIPLLFSDITGFSGYIENCF
jgi:hypothetical protein